MSNPKTEISSDLMQRLRELAEERGVTVSDLVRVALRNIEGHVGIYDLDTRMGFGKYVSETVETVIRCDPRYAAWAALNVERFRLGATAQALLDHTLGIPVDGEGDEP